MRTRRPTPLRLASLLLLAAAGACDSPAADPTEADVVYHNGTIHTVAAGAGTAQAVAIADGRFVAVGTDAEALALAGPSTRVVDLEGRTVVPGFGDDHIHIGGELQEWEEGTFISAVTEWTREARDWEALREVLARRAAETPPGEWIQGGLTRVDWPNQRVPSRWQLDEVVPDHPLALTRGPHTAVLNSRALEIVGITRSTPNPPGGWIIRDENGEPSGRVLEAARRLIDPYLPETPRPEGEALIQRYRTQLTGLLSVGLTHVDVAGVRPDGLRAVQELYERYGEELPRMTVEVRLRPGWDAWDDPLEGAAVSIEELEGLGFRTGFGNDRLKIGAIKLGADGGLSAPVFWSTEPYRGRPDFHGEQLIHDDALYLVGKRAHELGWQLGIHTIGDASAVHAVDVLARILEESPRDDHRHFLHHATVRPPDRTIGLMADLGIGAAVHPSWTTALGAYASEALEGERLQTQNPSRSYLDAGVWVSYGSDQLPYGPIYNIWNGVTRVGWDGEVYGPQEAITAEEGLRLHTMGSAYQNFDEDVRGSIEVGKLADLVVLDEDILAVAPERIRDVRVMVTVVGGREVYVRGSGATQ